MDLAAILKIAELLAKLGPIVYKTISEISPLGADLVDKLRSGGTPTEAEWAALHDQIETKTSHILGSQGQL